MKANPCRECFTPCARRAFASIFAQRPTPNAGRDEVAGLWRDARGDERLAVKVAAPPDKGKANAAVIKLLAKTLCVPKSSVSIVAGETARMKTVDIDGEAEDLAQRLDLLGAKDD